jgi:hypothetical protein
MKKLYFDNNIIIDLQNGRRESLIECLKKIDKSEFQILFGPGHIEEIAAIVMHHGNEQEAADVKLDFLANLTDSTVLLPFKRRNLLQIEHDGIFIYKEYPRDTYKRVIAHYDRNQFAENHQKEKIETGEKLEKVFEVSSKEVNNIEISKEIDLFKPRLHAIVSENYNYLVSNGLLIEYLPLSVPKCDELNFSFSRRYFPLHEMIVEKIFEFLEARRYFPDKSNQFLSGLHDTTHAIYAAYCDIFVTNDKNLRNKAAATFSWLGIDTLILSPGEFVDYVTKQSNKSIQPTANASAD